MTATTRNKTKSPSRARPAPRPKAADTPSRVLSAARAVMIEDGHARFSARRVAAKAGISVGNLTYHFSDKRSLVRALVSGLLAEYEAEIERQLSDVAQGEDDRFGSLVAWLVRDSASTATMRLFRELWALALHDKAAARALDDFYDAAMAHGRTLLMKLRPDLGKAEAERLVLLSAMISEGSSVLFGTRRVRGFSAAEMAGFAAEAVKRMSAKPRSRG